MATTQINFYTDLPFGQLRIFVDPHQNAKAIKLLKETPQAIARAYQKSTEAFANKVIKRVRECINRGVPPKGATWPPLSKKYVQHEGGDDRIYYKTGQYFESVGLYKERVEYYRSTKVGSRQYVGLPNQVTKLPTRSHKKGLLTLQLVARILESGSRVGEGSRGYVPQRALWKPVYEEVGGKRSLVNSIQTNLQNEFKKLI